MALIVQKYGGTSVGSIERIKEAAKRVYKKIESGNQVIVVVSAMAGETNRLVNLARDITPETESREFDLLVASGEQVSVGLFCLAFNQLSKKFKARPFLGYQLGIRTDNVFSKARIHGIEATLLKECFSKNQIPVVAGFQGVDEENNITTLGRGGSDTSAVAIAAAVKADLCEILTDVEGVFTADPRICPLAKRLEKISYEEMMELAGLGAKVLQIRSVEIAAKFQVPLKVGLSFEEKEGTMIVSKEGMEQVLVSGVAHDLTPIQITLNHLPQKPGVAAQIFSALAEAHVSVDVIVQGNTVEGGSPHVTIHFTVQEGDFETALKTLQKLQKKDFPKMEIQKTPDLAKVGIVGVGMQFHPGVAAKMFQILGEEKIDIKLITTSEIKVACLIERKEAQKAVQALHRGFGLDRDA